MAEAHVVGRLEDEVEDRSGIASVDVSVAAVSLLERDAGAGGERDQQQDRTRRTVRNASSG